MKRTLGVTGMSCGSCEGLIRDELGALDGVRSVSASASAGSVEVDLDETQIDVAQLAQVISELGFRPSF